ncbi:MAG: Lrp/AsnC family transcriptional regulator [Candidatus Dormibacteria bacterium]
MQPSDVMAEAEQELTNGRQPHGLTSDPGSPLDAIDLAILVLLLRDARSSVRRIAAGVGMSAPAVSERIARLERNGVVRGYRAEVDWARLGYGLTAHLMVTGVQGWEQIETVEALRHLHEVESVEVVTGTADLVVRVRVRDHAHLRECLFERIWKVAGVHRTETMICLGEDSAKPFDLELAESLLEAAG